MNPDEGVAFEALLSKEIEAILRESRTTGTGLSDYEAVERVLDSARARLGRPPGLAEVPRAVELWERALARLLGVTWN